MECPQCGAELRVPCTAPAELYQTGDNWAVVHAAGILGCPWCRFDAHVDYWAAQGDPERRIYENVPFEPKTHWLNIEPKYFYAVLTGNKRFEIRKNDRGFRVGHRIVLKMWDKEHGFYNKTLPLRITHVNDFPAGLRPGWVVIGWEKL